jgi:hypothetical protein
VKFEASKDAFSFDFRMEWDEKCSELRESQFSSGTTDPWWGGNSRKASKSSNSRRNWRISVSGLPCLDILAVYGLLNQ